MNVLVTGATAPLGGALIARLLANPTVAHVLEVGAEPGVDTSPRHSYHRVDLRRSRAVHDLIYGPARSLGIDVVVHAAMHRRAHDEGLDIHRRNVDATRQLLQMCAQVGSIRRFVFLSSAAVYALRAREPNLLDENAALEFDPQAPQWVRDRVEADLSVCSQMGMSPLRVIVLRCAEILAADLGSQLWDYLQSRVCLRPAGFDPMLNLLSLDDAVDAIGLAIASTGQGTYNLAGADTLPLSRLIARFGRLDLPVPEPLLAPLYHLRTRTIGLDFRYDLNARRFHLGGILDDQRARRELGYRPRHPLFGPPTPGPRLGANAPCARQRDGAHIVH